MKICPSCQTRYTDDTLRFCLQDGTPLRHEAEQLAGSLSGREEETVARERPRQDESVETKWKKDDGGVSSRGDDDVRSAGPSGWFVGAAIGLVLFAILAGAGMVGLWMYFRDAGGETAKNTNNGNNLNRDGFPPFNFNINAIVTPTRTPTPTPSPTVPTNTNSFKWPPFIPGSPTPSVDKGKASQEVSQLVGGWRSEQESGDLNALTRRYASSVDYYRKSGASPDFIRADKQRAFRTYDSISLSISNMDITVAETGQTATAVFDKEWVFEGSKRSTGKVRQQLQFVKVNGQWLIAAERDLKVYYSF